MCLSSKRLKSAFITKETFEDRTVLGKTTGWIHRANLKHHGIQSHTGVRYVKFDDAGLHVKSREKPMVLHVDHVVVCARSNV